MKTRSNRESRCLSLNLNYSSDYESLEVSDPFKVHCKIFSSGDIEQDWEDLVRHCVKAMNLDDKIFSIISNSSFEHFLMDVEGYECNEKGEIVKSGSKTV